jgi:hypothetical protein
MIGTQCVGDFVEHFYWVIEAYLKRHIDVKLNVSMLNFLGLHGR